jgi:uncharacterized protein
MEDNSQKILIGGSKAGQKIYLNPGMANRHGLIAGATGTGKTVSLQILAENLSKLGVPVFTADIKGDLSGIAEAGKPGKKITERIETIGIDGFTPQGCPVLFWDLYGEKGHPLRTTVSEIGPVLFSKILDLNETQEGVLHIAFRMADEEGLLLLDLKDLRGLLKWIADNAAEIRSKYGNVSGVSIAAIQRRLLVLEDAGGDKFLGEPALKLEHLMMHDFSGRGVVNILDATRLIQNTRLYSAFLLWLLSELFEELEEVGDPDRPRLVFFFDEAHLLFRDTPAALLEKIEQVVRLIRSKGVGVYFVTQHPLDIPDTVLSQLGHRIQHALRAFTPRDRKAVKTAAQTFRQNPKLKAEKVITELGVGEALVSVLDKKGRPTIVEQTLIVPPESRIGPLKAAERKSVLGRSPIKGVYDETVDRESAYELLKKRERQIARKRAKKKKAKKGYTRQSKSEAFTKSLLRSVGSQIGRYIIRGIMGTFSRSR